LLDALEEINNNGEFVRIRLEAAENLRLARGAVPVGALTPQRSGPRTGDSEFQHAAKAALRSLYPIDTDEEARHRLVGISNHAIRRSEDAIAEAWALRRLGERFHDGASRTLSPQSRQLLEFMAREHLLTLRSQVTELDSLLNAMLSRIGFERAPVASPAERFAAVERLRILVQTALVGGSSALGSPAEVSREIAALSKFLSADLSDADAAIERMFPRPASGAPVEP
jgi:hypothetical protein